MEQTEALNVAIVGGGPGCKAIIDIIFAAKLSQLRMKLIGVACTNPNAVGYRYAQEKGIYTTRDYRDLYKLQDVNMIIELTGREEVTSEISRTKPEHIRLMGHVAARLFWDVFQIEEERIAERTRAEDALRESEDKYSRLVENSLTGIYIDQDGKIAFANNKFAEIYRYSRHEVIGMESWRLVHPEDRGLTAEIRAKRLTGQDAPSEYEARGLTKDGETIWIVRRNTQVEYKGRPAILGNIVDITERKRAEDELRKAHEGLELRVKERTAELMTANEQLRREIEERKRAEKALRESEEKYRIITSAAQDAIVMMDHEGNISYWNPAAERIFGYTTREAIGKELHIFLGPQRHHKAYKEGFKRFQETGRGAVIGKMLELSAIRKDGTEFPIELSVSGVRIKGKWYATGIIRDITERKQTEKELKFELSERKRAEEALRLAHRHLATKATALEAANEELSQYAHVVSHDLKAPLRAIHNYADFLREDLEATLDGELKAYLDGLRRAVRQGEELVGDLLELFRVGSQSGPVHAIDVGVFLAKLIASLDLPPDVEVVMENDWPGIDAEPTLLKQIFRNLISNAIKFNHSPRKRIEFGWLPAGKDRYELFVHDNGIGIEPRYHELIFRVFQRLHTREEYEGTGLGLAIVKKATAKLNGSIRVESKAGHGSTFFVALPKAQKET